MTEAVAEIAGPKVGLGAVDHVTNNTLQVSLWTLCFMLSLFCCCCSLLAFSRLNGTVSRCVGECVRCASSVYLPVCCVASSDRIHGDQNFQIFSRRETWCSVPTDRKALLLTRLGHGNPLLHDSSRISVCVTNLPDSRSRALLTCKCCAF